MLWARKFLVGLFSLVLVVALVGGAVFFGIEHGFKTPKRSEQWLQQSRLYDALISSATTQIKQSATTADQSLLLGVTTPLIQNALVSAVPAQSVNNDIKMILNSNYAWLAGTTNHPNFSIDLTGIKPALAAHIDQAITTKVAQLPTCTSSQLSQLLSASLLTLTCRPAEINLDTTFAELKQEITTSSSFLTNPAITPSSLNPNTSSKSEPYYQKVSYLPKLFQLSEKLPIAFAGLALLSMVIILLASSTRRGSWRLCAKLFIIASIILLAGKLMFQITFNKLQLHLFSGSTNNQFQPVAASFAHLATNYLAHILLLVAAAYTGLALIIILGLSIAYLYKKYHRVGAKRQNTIQQVNSDLPESRLEQPLKPKRKKIPRAMDVFVAPPATTDQTNDAAKTTKQLEVSKSVKPKKRTKLNRPGSIQ